MCPFGPLSLEGLAGHARRQFKFGGIQGRCSHSARDAPQAPERLSVFPPPDPPPELTLFSVGLGAAEEVFLVDVGATAAGAGAFELVGAL